MVSHHITSHHITSHRGASHRITSHRIACHRMRIIIASRDHVDVCHLPVSNRDKQATCLHTHDMQQQQHASASQQVHVTCASTFTYQHIERMCMCMCMRMSTSYVHRAITCTHMPHSLSIHSILTLSCVICVAHNTYHAYTTHTHVSMSCRCACRCDVSVCSRGVIGVRGVSWTRVSESREGRRWRRRNPICMTCRQ